MIGDILAVLLIVGPVMWAFRRAEKLAEQRTAYLALRIDAIADSIGAARSEKAMRLSALPGLNARQPAESGPRLVQKEEVATDGRETLYDRPSDATHVYGRK